MNDTIQTVLVPLTIFAGCIVGAVGIGAVSYVITDQVAKARARRLPIGTEGLTPDLQLLPFQKRLIDGDFATGGIIPRRRGGVIVARPDDDQVIPRPAPRPFDWQRDDLDVRIEVDPPPWIRGTLRTLNCESCGDLLTTDHAQARGFCEGCWTILGPGR